MLYCAMADARKSLPETYCVIVARYTYTSIFLVSSESRSIGSSVLKRLTKVGIEAHGDVPMHHMPVSAVDAYFLLDPS